MGILSSGFSLITNFFPQVKAIAAGGSALIIVGVAGYLYYQQESRLNQINLLQQQNSALTTTVNNLTTANTALNNQVAAEKLNTAMISSELNNIIAIDESNQAQLIKTQQTLAADKPNVLLQRNSPTEQSAFINTVNANMDCFFATFNNMETGSCLNGKFVAYSPLPPSALTVAPQK